MAANASDAMSDPAPPEAAAGSGRDRDPVKRWTIILLLLSAVLLAWYLRADRITPYTSQARLHALVVPVAPEVSGTITDVEVRNNQTVSKDDPLFRIDQARYEYALQSALAALDQARQAQGAAEANVRSARASVESARASEEKARLDAVRMRNIRAQDPGALSERRLESAEASLTSAQSRVTSAEASLQAAIEQLGKPGDDNAAVQQALAAVETARLNLDRATVRAPENGVVTGVQLDRGNFAAAGAPQLTFIATHNVWIQADFTENNLGHLDPGDPVGVVFDLYPGRVFEGTVREIGFGVALDDPPLGALPTITNDTSWLRSAQRYPVLIDFELPVTDDGRVRLKVGSQASVTVFSGEHPLFNALARFYLRLVSWLSYAY
ncbi:MAG: HlyD family secretion protein [Xanthomonadales bacterium]|nr:HlyD family secretion protein [Xanthomonadales bacterium]